MTHHYRFKPYEEEHDGLYHEGGDEVWADIRALDDYIDRVKERIKLGVYSEERDGDLLAVLEEIERILR